MSVKKEIEIISKEKVKIKLIGVIDFKNSDLMEDEVLKLMNKNYKILVIDFDEVESIDSSGIGKLLMLNKKLQSQDRELVLSNVNSDYLKNIFETISLKEIMKFED